MRQDHPSSETLRRKTLCNRLVLRQPRSHHQRHLQGLAVNPNMSLDSNHITIKFQIDHGLKEITDFLPRKYCINKIDPEEWSKLFEQELNKVEDKLTVLYEPRTPTDLQLDVYAETLSSAIQSALASAAPECKPSQKAKPWWDQQLSKATSRIGEAKNTH